MIGFYNASVILTYLGVVSAVFGMSQAFNGNFKIAILCLMISGLTDMYDGTIAKMIKRSEDAKKFGIEIDSLCDLVCFGVYPVVIGYCLGMDQWYARIIYMCYVLGGVIRLAYFNVTEEQRQAHSSSRRKHYQGLPITSVALIIPIVYQLRRFFPEEFPYIYVAMLAVIAFLFVFDFKACNIADPNLVWMVGSELAFQQVLFFILLLFLIIAFSRRSGCFAARAPA